MISLNALNAASCTDDSLTVFHEVRQEEQETEALALYNEALACKGKDRLDKAEEKFLAVLETELIKQSAECLPEGEDLTHQPALFLKYNVFKNLAVMSDASGDIEKALDYYLEAAVVDESDVSLWWQIGEMSIKILNIRLARYAFEKGLIYSPNHWLCLDKLITILYIIGDYLACLEMISKALEVNEGYTKGYAIRDQIFKEEPHFKRDCIELRSLYAVDEERDEIEYQTYIEEALIIRGKRKLLAKPEEFPKLKLNKPILYYTWLNLGESLLHLYSELTDPSQNQSLCWRVDLTKYHRSVEQQASLSIPSPDTLAKKYTRCSLKDNESKAAKRKRITPLPLEKENELQPKRRSTRVKLSRSKESDINWSDLLYSFLPSTCKVPCLTDTDDSQDSQDSVASFAEKQTSQAYWGSPEEIKKESILVSNFINENMKNSGCIDLIGNFLMALTDFWDTRWCSGLATIFRCLYDKYRKHTLFPNPLDTDYDPVYMTKLSKVILMALEFQLDYVMLSKGGVYSGSPSTIKITKFGKDELSRFLSDMHYVAILAAANNLFTNVSPFCIRFYWVQGRYCVMKTETVPAINSLNNCLHVLTESGHGEVILHNCQTENVISAEAIEGKIETVQQCQSLEELEDIFNKGNYNGIIKALEPVIMEQQGNKISDVNMSPERPAQLILLQDSYFHTKHYKKCLICADIGLGEALNSLPATDIWKSHLNVLLTSLNNCLCCKEAEELFDEYLLQQICDKFIKLIEFVMDADSIDMDQVTTLPWLLLYKIIKFNFKKEKEKEVEGEQSTVIYANPVLSYLRNAHDYLGRKHWCCHDNGLLLQEFIEEGMCELNKQLHPDERELVSLDLEQCFYCLYGNPCKKSRSKIIQEHNDQPVPLTWEKAKTLYYFYKPPGLPEPDLRANTISFEVQNAFRKIVTVVPQRAVEVIKLEVLQQYIDGSGNLPEVTEAEMLSKKTGLEDLFYYLGDYYFKNKEFTKALKFYMHDVSVKPDRFQSWAAMALTRQTRLEEKINECEMRSDCLIKKHITSTLRCFKKAVAINKNRCVILEEYGQAAYMLSSYCARKLLEGIQDEKEDLSSQDGCKTMQTDMLLLSQTCFTDALLAASTKEGERWMHYYMLGKASENLKKPVDTYLNYYQKSVEELWTSGARVWKKVPYHGAPEYSIESLELLYRIHASILKVIKYSDIIDFETLEKHLELVANQKLYADMLEIDKAALRESEAAALVAAQKAAPMNTTAYLPNDAGKMKDTSKDTPTEESSFCEENLQNTEDLTACGSSPDLFSPSLSQNSGHAICDSADTDITNCNEIFGVRSQFLQCSGLETAAISDLMNYLLDQVCETSETNPNDSKGGGNSDDSKGGKFLADFSFTCSDKSMSSENSDSISQTDLEGTVSGDVGQDVSDCMEHMLRDVLRRLEMGEEKKLNPLCRKTLIVRNFDKPGDEERFNIIAQRCLEAFGFCLRRFPEHFKSQYAMAHFLAYSHTSKNLQWSRDLLLGNSSDEKYSIPLPAHGIFSGKKKTNLFQYLWKIPIAEIDRPGSFGTHVHKCVCLLLDVLYKLRDSQLLLHVSGFLHKTPEKEKKYLRDNDRAFLAIKAFDFALDILKTRIDELSLKDDIKQFLVDVHEAYKHALKMQLSIQTAEDYMTRVYTMISPSKNTDVNRQQLLDEAIKLCQQPNKPAT